MPGLITIPEFVREAREDFNSPTTSTFCNRIPHCRDTINRYDEALNQDKECLSKLKGSLKEIHKSGINHHGLEMEMTKILDRMGDTAISREEEEDEVGAAFRKFAVLTKELSLLMKNLMNNLNTIIMFPVENVLKNDLRGSKGDLKRPFDRALRDYTDKFSEIERTKKKQAEKAGMIRQDLSPAEIADELDKERKYLQISMADYFLKVNEIKAKKGSELLVSLLEYYKAQVNYFTDGLRTIEHFGTYIEDLTVKLSGIKTQQEDERRALIDVKNCLKNSAGIHKMNGTNSTSQYTLHQAKGDAKAGDWRDGYLLKRSEGRLRNVWQRRRCEVRDGFLKISHADESKTPSQVNLLTCQMKPVLEDRLCFDVVSYNRTYHFQAETEYDRDEWMSVLLNSKEKSLNRAFEDNGRAGGGGENQGLVEFQRTLVTYIRNLPSNGTCADCSSQNDVTWLSTNYGIIVCIECSGIHREMGVHVSKIQSLTLDHIGTSQLLVARMISNAMLNKILESRATWKPKPNSTMEERKSFIRAKYLEKSYCTQYCATKLEVYSELEQAIATHNLTDLIQAASEAPGLGAELTDSLPDSEFCETFLHLAINQENGSSLHIVDFLVQNSVNLDKKTKEGNTPLHYCVIQNQPEAMRLLLRSGASPDMPNNNGKTPLNIARERGYKLCEELLLHALDRQKTMFENVNIDWNLHHDDMTTDFSDEETLEDTSSRTLNRTPDRRGGASGGNRPMSVYTPVGAAEDDSPENNRSQGSTSDWSRSNTSDSGDSPGSYRTNAMPPPPPPQSKKPSLFSGSNLANHFVGSLKKGAKGPTSSPANYATLPSQHQMRITNGSGGGSRTPAGVSSREHTSPQYSLPPAHKRSPSTDSGNAGSRSTTPVSYRIGGNFNTSPRGKLLHTPLKSFIEEKTPPTVTPLKLSNGQSTESLESLSDEISNNTRSMPNTHTINRRRLDLQRFKKCRALYDCEADNEDELTFEEGDIIIIMAEETEDENWMEGVLEAEPDKRGLFPASFVHMLTD